jgi:antirestriction protein
MERPPETGAGPHTTGRQEDNHEMHEHEQLLNPRIYAASLADYNNGILHGTWIDATQDAPTLRTQVDAMLAKSPTGFAEEFAVHDYEGFGEYRVGEYDSLNLISRIAHGIHDHGPAFAAWASHCEHDPDALDRFEDAYLGDWSNAEAYADDLLESTGLQDIIDRHIPDDLQPYVKIDVEAFAHDLELGGDITVVPHDDGVWIFDGTA